MKLSAIMVRPRRPLSSLDERTRDFLRWFLFEFFEGLDTDHGRRWLRWWARWFNRADLQSFYPQTPRSGAFHAMHMAIEMRILKHQDAFVPDRPGTAAFRTWLKTGACFGRFVATPSGLVFEPSSLSYEECSDDEMREFHLAALDFLRSPFALSRLWPAMSLTDAGQTLELLLKNPEEDS